MPVANDRHTARSSPGIAHPLSRLCASDLRRRVPYTYRALQISPVHLATPPLSVSCSSRQRFASGVRQTPTHPAALAVQRMVPRVESVEDFLLQEGAPCRAHTKIDRSLARRFRACAGGNPSCGCRRSCRHKQGNKHRTGRLRAMGILSAVRYRDIEQAVPQSSGVRQRRGTRDE